MMTTRIRYLTHPQMPKRASSGKSKACWPVVALFVGHGAVGTLWFCHYSGFAIDRAHDQPAGGGHYFAFNKDGRRVLHPWRRMEDMPLA